MRNARFSNRGFTFVEVLVACAVLAILATVAYGALGQMREKARDAERIAELQQVAVALRLYKDQYGRYPERGCSTVNPSAPWASPGPGVQSWYAQCDDYIPGLVPQFLHELPRDPMSENNSDQGFLYRTNSTGSEYKLLVSPTEGAVLNPGDPYARCPSTCSNSYCTQATYAVYSSGGACW